MEKTRLYREAREAVKLRDDFLSIAGHELRTPMTAALLQVQGLSRLLARQPASLGSALPGFEDKLETLQRQMRRLRTLVDRLLDISRMRGLARGCARRARRPVRTAGGARPRHRQPARAAGPHLQ
ncbi:MAG TPA: histidine kinase dimerization/phospho-acceptor domain-containing protein [Myxococcaceae bacterium]|nr:histidine kinase dimerization/phospho-acceptor domain-containing protein [Myxococcaceae bacterium]